MRWLIIIPTRPRNCGTFGLMEKVAKIQEARVDECLPKIKEVAGQITFPCWVFVGGHCLGHGKSWEVKVLVLHMFFRYTKIGRHITWHKWSMNSTFLWDWSVFGVHCWRNKSTNNWLKKLFLIKNHGYITQTCFLIETTRAYPNFQRTLINVFAFFAMIQHALGKLHEPLTFAQAVRSKMDDLRKQLRSLPTMAESEADQFKLFNNTLEARLQVEFWTSFGVPKNCKFTTWCLNDLSANKKWRVWTTWSFWKLVVLRDSHPTFGMDNLKGFIWKVTNLSWSPPETLCLCKWVALTQCGFKICTDQYYSKVSHLSSEVWWFVWMATNQQISP